MKWIRDDGLPNPLEKLGIGMGFFRRYADSFWKATGMEVDLIYADGEPWNSVARRVKGSFCREVTHNPSKTELCRECFLGACREARMKNEFHTVNCHAGQRFSVRSLGKVGGTDVLLLTGRVMTGDPEDTFEALACKGSGPHDIKSQEAYQSALDLIEFSLPYLQLRLDVDLLLAARSLPPLVLKACRYVDEHFREDINVAGVATACAVSVGYLSHSFSKHTGNTLSHYISAVRTGHAMYLLRREQPAISEIAFEVGFQSLSQFNRTFRGLRGMAPGEFRRQELNEGEREADSAQ